MFSNLVSSGENIQIQYQSREDQEARIAIFNIQGSVILQKALSLSKGQGVFEINPAALERGLVLIRFASEYQSIKTFKLLIE